MPGMDATGSRRPLPSITNSGWMRSSAESRVSRERRREKASRRMRRMRVPGYLPVVRGSMWLLARGSLG